MVPPDWSAVSDGKRYVGAKGGGPVPAKGMVLDSMAWVQVSPVSEPGRR